MSAMAQELAPATPGLVSAPVPLPSAFPASTARLGIGERRRASRRPRILDRTGSRRPKGSPRASNPMVAGIRPTLWRCLLRLLVEWRGCRFRSGTSHRIGKRNLQAFRTGTRPHFGRTGALGRSGHRPIRTGAAFPCGDRSKRTLRTNDSARATQHSDQRERVSARDNSDRTRMVPVVAQGIGIRRNPNGSAIAMMEPVRSSVSEFYVSCRFGAQNALAEGAGWCYAAGVIEQRWFDLTGGGGRWKGLVQARTQAKGVRACFRSR